MGLPFESWYVLARMRRSPSFESSTALVDVDPPSRPTNPSTISPGWKVVATNFLGRYFFLNAARSASSFANPPVALRLVLSWSRPTLTYQIGRASYRERV